MPRVTMVQHVNVQITDRQRTREWYEKVLGARFRDRGPERNQRQLQLHIGTAEMHFTEINNPIISPRAHFALEVENWDEMLAHLDALGITHFPNSQAASSGGVGDGRRWGQREDTGERSTYIRDPDGNLIELIYHPLGMVDADGNKVEVPTHPEGIRWRQVPEVEAALGIRPAS